MIGSSTYSNPESQGGEITMRTRSPEETIALGTVIGRAAQQGLFLALFGELGSGKTKLTQGIARGLDVPETYRVTSPSFTLINEYPGRLPLSHIDLYRLGEPEELFDLGYEEYFYNDGVVVLEWAERAGLLLPPRRIDISITHLGELEREFAFTFRQDTFTTMKENLLLHSTRNDEGNR
jgi:tRNA threonylcarbamoyladenosine biosynthesis protein TsaE